jgi:hypothetical protein
MDMRCVTSGRHTWPSVLEEAAGLRSLTGLHGVGATLGVLTTSCLEGVAAPEGWNVAAPGVESGSAWAEGRCPRVEGRSAGAEGRSSRANRSQCSH